MVLVPMITGIRQGDDSFIYCCEKTFRDPDNLGFGDDDRTPCSGLLDEAGMQQHLQSHGLSEDEAMVIIKSVRRDDHHLVRVNITELIRLRHTR